MGRPEWPPAGPPASAGDRPSWCTRSGWSPPERRLLAPFASFVSGPAAPRRHPRQVTRDSTLW